MRRLFFAAVVVAQLVVLYWPREVSTGGVPYLDKAIHLSVFGTAVWAGARAGLPLRLVVPAFLLHAPVSELVQHYLLPGRDGDVFDALADCVGVACGAGVAIFTGLGAGRFRAVTDPG
ncbi:VanZ family protein [Spongisporangium articulatum]|uniref:VanZ family protein n=1 Tax=Spongisporangium articulatum TaxID=3362603 RepID=A0ABW8AK51_9ACTN